MRPNKPIFFEWILCIGWAIYWGLLSYFALFEKGITLRGKLGNYRLEGLPAVIYGFIFLGLALLGLSWLLRSHPYKRLYLFLIFLTWLLGVLIYFVFID